MTHRVLVFATYNHPPIYTVSNYFVPHLRLLPSNPLHPGRCANSSARYWRCLQVAQFPWTGTLARPHDWYSKAKRTWRSWGIWAWAWRQDHDGFEVHWGGWNHWSWLQVLEDIGSNKQRAATWNYKDACLLWNSEGEEKLFVPAGFSAWYLRHLQGLVPPQLCCWTLKMKIHITPFSSRGTTSSTNCHFLHIFCKLW